MDRVVVLLQFLDLERLGLDGLFAVFTGLLP